jgi:hypothetical protein
VAGLIVNLKPGLGGKFALSVFAVRLGFAVNIPLAVKLQMLFLSSCRLSFYSDLIHFS